LNIDAAPAMVGWDFSGSKIFSALNIIVLIFNPLLHIYCNVGGCHPVYDGYVVCEEFADLVMDAWNQEQENKVGRDADTVKIQYGIFV
jgi:hypothetical protein